MPGPLLALDTSTSIGSVAVGADGALLAEAVFNAGAGHSAALLPAMDWTLRSAGIERSELAGVVVGSGPGSFTGLRIAAATAKGLMFALGVPLHAYSGLLAVAAGVTADRPVCALFDARRRDVYAAAYRIGTGADGVEQVFAPEALALDKLLDRFRGGPPPLFAGEGATLHRAEIERELGARVAPPHLAFPRASALLWLAGAVPERGWVEDPVAWEPEYVRPSGAERIAAARAGGGTGVGG